MGTRGEGLCTGDPQTELCPDVVDWTAGTCCLMILLAVGMDSSLLFRQPTHLFTTGFGSVRDGRAASPCAFSDPGPAETSSAAAWFGHLSVFWRLRSDVVSLGLLGRVTALLWHTAARWLVPRWLAGAL